MLSNKTLAFLLPVMVTVNLSACDSKSEPTKENLSAAVRQQMNRELATCAEVPVQHIPFDVPQRKAFGGDPVREAGDALTKVGLLARTDGSYVYPSTQNPVPGYHYSLTDEGKKYARTIQGMTGSVAFCGGKQELVDLLVPDNPPTQAGSAIPVSFTVKVVDAPRWMSDPDVIRVFGPEVDLTTRPSDMVLRRTSDGWSASR